MRVLIVGLGLIGGSFAKAFKSRTSHTVIGYDIDKATMDFALARGVIDEKAGDSSVASADLTVVCLYPAACVEFIRSNAALFKSDAVIMDACGVKGIIYDGLEDVIRQHKLRFVGAHPMAGKEHHGFDYSDGELYEGASLIVTPEGADEDAVRLVCDTALEIGFGSCKVTDKATHDLMIAYTSQLAHVLACSYISDPLSPEHKGFSAGSFRDVTRVALINEEMWTELFLNNKAALSKEIGVLVDNLGKFRDAIDRDDADALRTMMKKSRELKETI